MVSAAPVYAAIGNFDGVHLGHQQLLRAAISVAQTHGGEAGVIVFDPHPRRYFRPDDPPFLLTTPAQRNELLRSYGAQQVFSLTFDEALVSLSPEEFVRDILAGKLALAGVLTGADFRFGARRAGDTAMLHELGRAHGLKVDVIELVIDDADGGKYGSTVVRNALLRGDAAGAAHMLGRPWAVRGTVLEGQKLGRTLGFPTANMTLGEYLAPRRGVYAVMAVIGERAFKAIANFGRRPTLGSGAPLLETHIFDFAEDIYGEKIEVRLIDFIREERKFDGLDALQAQIAQDCDKALKILT